MSKIFAATVSTYFYCSTSLKKKKKKEEALLPHCIFLRAAQELAHAGGDAIETHKLKFAYFCSVYTILCFEFSTLLIVAHRYDDFAIGVKISKGGRGM